MQRGRPDRLISTPLRKKTTANFKLVQAIAIRDLEKADGIIDQVAATRRSTELRGSS
jgi:hypothetical protein